MTTRCLMTTSLMLMMFALNGCSGGSSSAEKAVVSVTSAFDQLAERLAKVSTAEELAKAQPDLRKIGENLKAAMAAMKELEKTDAAVNEAIGRKLGPAMAAARQRAFAEVERIGKTIDPLAPDRIQVMMGME